MAISVSVLKVNISDERVETMNTMNTMIHFIFLNVNKIIHGVGIFYLYK